MSGHRKSVVGVAREDFPVSVFLLLLDSMKVFESERERERERERENFLRELAKTLLENWFSEF